LKKKKIDHITQPISNQSNKKKTSEHSASRFSDQCIESIRPILFEWIESSESPLQEDIEIIFNYSKNVLEGSDLEKLALILKYLKRFFFFLFLFSFCFNCK